MSGEHQTNINMPSHRDPLLEYRMTKAEEAITVLSDGFAQIAATIRGAKWAFLIIFGFLQPVGIAIMIHFLTGA